ncbi:MAG: 50S ribosomal protein L29 [Aigarchaeota archaeon]|nr:50S ribosomal protein L29 [Aigarchaeota archaeon]MDW8092202.1 50S ribosomal protein L29 [Nitrososphaerota archaeon]
MTKRVMTEIRNKSDEELRGELVELRTELRNLRSRILSGGSVEKPSNVRTIRRRIARILTVLREREGKA